MKTALGQLADQVLFQNYGKRDIALVRGEGAYVYDDEGRRYLDFTAGIAVCNLGHAHPGVTEVIERQARTLVHVSNLFLIEGQVELAEKLTRLADRGTGPYRAMFVNTGTEANEGALKLARRYQYVSGHPEKTRVVALPNSFHGRTMGSLSVTSNPKYREGVTPLVPGFEVADTYEGAIDMLDDKTAACIVEVVQGEAGVRPVDKGLLQSLAARAKELGALLIVDEVQTGVGRTGRFFGFEHFDLSPDIITMAKGLGNGIPTGAILAKQHVADAFTPGMHGSTFGGNPFAMAVANYVVDVVRDPAFLDRVRRVGEALRRVLEANFDGVTGLGLMWGFDVDDASTWRKRAAERGLLVTACGPKRIRVVPPLIIDEQHVEEFETIVKKIGRA
ncbi:aspartate aminotransferase family protein [Alicyclobacillus acidocaldarius]|uniref:Acetylornithine and succinylornithine aminotransferase n=1 Tax=Alicyclobacillus acidocaldarius subsp. acidocaldarius (strain ATCC 27009 / DSM 446 / BCRC 14685 / JCM 5260 / KCTC 1825 / NBRC 15652 / NCIMB 11725 / NRRL B-14509 / 104-IA) TaxID=521098 RepID=C8WVY1_ALIAD|nr:acetylornithine/succinylornithine family transaminase [Alicyclobacillus acidocaldarius]ACV58253.1 acetylornithine and succinylornithine aminotransferase [Alicyclobacillus acidocaldarius subsp. acidocaldarius DSM 446]